MAAPNRLQGDIYSAVRTYERGDPLLAAFEPSLTQVSISDKVSPMDDEIELERTADPKKLRVFLSGRPIGVVVKDSLGWRLEDGNLGDVRATPRDAAKRLVAAYGKETDRV